MTDMKKMSDPHNMFGKVKEFQTAFEASPDKELWLGLIREEAAEIMEAVEHLLKEVSDLAYVTLGYINVGGDLKDIDDKKITDVATALQWSNVIGEAIGTAKMREAFDRVHQSNMSKLGADGKPIRREDGKILKGPNYAPPVLSDLVRG